MSGLRIHTSNRTEILAEQLAQLVRTPLASPITAEIIVVQSQGMQRWVSMELARHNGICANCDFPFPNSFLEDIFKRMLPDMPEISPFDPDTMIFRLMGVLPKCIQRPEFKNLKYYLEGDQQQLKLFQISNKIADLFDQYLVFRPEMIFEWEKGNIDITSPHDWQAVLWCELVRGNEKRHRARLRQKLFEQIKRPGSNTIDLPERVSIFGISYLPPFHLQAFAELSRLIEINFFLLDPCQEYWADIVSKRELLKIQRKNPRVAENIEWYHFEEGNRILASMGSLGRDFFKLISGFDCEIHEHFEEPEDTSILTRVQADILRLIDRESPARFVSDAKGSYEPQREPLVVSGRDRSIQVHACHSPMREIEVLHDHLLAMFEEDPTLLPKDIMVMTPDIEIYAPYVRAVFDAQTEQTQRIPFSIADQSPRNESQIIKGFFTLLDIAGSRFEAAQVVRLLEFPGIKERFGLVETDLQIIERWITDTQIRWGIDAESRRRLGLPGFSENTWQAGLERLILGYAMPGENKIMFNGILPYDNIEGNDGQILGNFLAFIDRLFAWAQIADAPRKLSEWQETLLGLLNQFFRSDDSIERDLQFLRKLLEDLSSREAYSEFEGEIEPAVLRSYLKNRLDKSSYGFGFLTGGITFCAMLPMRSIPFKVICLIGMNYDTFPRDYQPLNFDLAAQNPRPGDRSRRNDDKHLFLESLISARNTLYISYVGQSIQDNSAIPPSVLVSELLDTIANSFIVSDQKILQRIVTRHRLQPFSAAYFNGEGTDLFSYSAENMLASPGSSKRIEPPLFITNSLPMTAEESEEWQIIDIDTLCLFFQHPAKFFIQRRLGIRLEEITRSSDEHENFSLSNLVKYQIEQNLIKSRLSGVDLMAFKPIQESLGQLPHGNVGDFHYTEMSIGVDAFVAKIEPIISSKSKDPLDVDLSISNFQLRGRLSDVYESGNVHIRYARQRVKDLIKAWIYHLVLSAAAIPSYPTTSF
ncbi:MAG: exodeoxyribonuclease V subunit gamma, partial [Desulfobacterales bacterium]